MRREVLILQENTIQYAR